MAEKQLIPIPNIYIAIIKYNYTKVKHIFTIIQSDPEQCLMYIPLLNIVIKLRQYDGTNEINNCEILYIA